MSHTCSTLLFHCIDFRFGSAVKKYMDENGLMDTCDIVAAAGGAKNLASPATPADAEFILRQIDISKHLHGIRSVILMNHTDCGGYGGRKAFASRDKEKKKHFDDMAAAKKMILEKYPDLEIKIVLADIEKNGEISFLSG